MGWRMRLVLTSLLLPPTGLAVAALLFAVLAARPGIRLARRRAAGTLAGLCLVALVLLSLPVVSSSLLAALDVGEPADRVSAAGAGAIVVLGGDVVRLPAGGLALGPLSLERLRAGAALHRRTGLPILVTGGLVDGTARPVGTLMAESLRADFGVPVRWTEDVSFDTWENASLSAPLLSAAGVRRVLLVTHAWHMRRSVQAFQHHGLVPVAAAVRLDPWPRLVPSEFLPRPSAWMNSYFALHEWLGQAWYAVRG